MSTVKVLVLVLIFIGSQHTIAEERVTFQNNVLTIPSIDTTEQVGRFQNIVFVPTEEGTWKLLEYKDNPNFVYINNATLFMTNTYPVQVFLEIKGYFTGCGGLGEINQRLVGRRFEITVNEAVINESAEMTCTADLKPFITTVPLYGYALETGAYSYKVNGRSLSTGEINSPMGEFEISEINILPTGCCN